MPPLNTQLGLHLLRPAPDTTPGGEPLAQLVFPNLSCDPEALRERGEIQMPGALPLDLLLHGSAARPGICNSDRLRRGSQSTASTGAVVWSSPATCVCEWRGGRGCCRRGMQSAAPGRPSAGPAARSEPLLSGHCLRLALARCGPCLSRSAPPCWPPAPAVPATPSLFPTSGCLPSLAPLPGFLSSVFDEPPPPVSARLSADPAHPAPHCWFLPRLLFFTVRFLLTEMSLFIYFPACL